MIKHMKSTLGLVAILVASMLLLPTEATAQQWIHNWSIDGEGGIAIPTEELAEVTDIGGTAGVRLSNQILPRLALRIDGDWALLSGNSFDNANAAAESGPDLNLWHYTAGVEAALIDPRSGWDLTWNVGAGGTTFDADDFTPVTNPLTSETVSSFTETYFTFNTGLRAGYEVTPNVNIYASGQWFLIFTDEEETAAFSALSGGEVNAFNSVSNLPITAGVKVKF